MCLKNICMLPELCMCVYVPTQVDASNANDKDAVDAAVAVDQSVPVPSVFAESPPKRQKLEIHPADLALEVANVKIYRSMYYKEGLCLKSCAYMCFKT